MWRMRGGSNSRCRQISQEWQLLLRKEALVIWLRTDLAATLARLRQDERSADQRPKLLTDDLEAETAALLKEREPLYLAGSDMVIDTADKTAEEAACSAMKMLMKNFYD